MRITNFRIWAVAIAFGFLAVPAHAITLNDPGVVGAYQGALANANPTSETDLAQDLLDLLDGQTDPAGCNVSTDAGCMAASDPGVAGGDTYSGTLTLTANEGGDSTGATYAIGKYDGVNGGYVLFYLPDLGGPIPTVSNPLWGATGTDQYALSHVRYFTSGTTVPDGGSTLILLGAALSGLGVARRFMKS
jgi:hypothetical protein